MGLFSTSPDKAARKLDAAVAKAARADAIPNAVLHVDAPRAGLRGTWAAGVADASSGAAMAPDTPFLSASVGKIAMAAAAFDLAAAGALDLDGPIADWIDADVLRGLPTEGVTARMLLANRSGLPDYFDDEVHPAHDGAPGLAALMVAEPDRAWTRDQLIAYARDHFAPFAPPGQRFLYSDLNWDLLGLVFEGVTGRPFHEVVRARVLAPLGMASTWYHALEPAPDGVGRYADVLAGDVNLAHRPCLSLDLAGGGLATTAEDLGLLVRGLHEGRPVSLDQLGADWTLDAMSRGLDYGYGTWRWRPGRIFPLLWRLPRVRGVSGSTNSFAYVTARGDVVTGTLDQTDDPARHVKLLLAKVLPVLERLMAAPTTG